ncbi:MAG: class I SAM-dependent methyltransferase [Alphaproteobacteria bacterium]|nr:class I SAM-dependent methyltransferase [Alphaproteobacteria bacterium]
MSLLSFFKQKHTEVPQPRIEDWPLTYRQDGLWTIHNADFMTEPKFASAYARAVQAEKDHNIQWRIHILTWAATNAMKIPGDFVECGVNRGAASSAIMTYVGWNANRGARTYYLMDTFQGLVPELVNDEERAIGRLDMFEDAYPECYEQTKKNFDEFDENVMIRGPIPDTLPQNKTQHIAFMHIDMNCAAPETAAMRYFWPKVQRGGIVVLDDYAYHGYQPQKDAMDALGREIGFMVASLPTGQGLIVKSS